MNIKEKFKVSLAKKMIARQKKNKPFDESYAELYQLPQNADKNYNNSYYFSCHDAGGNSIIFRLGKRGDNTNEIWFAFKDGSGDIFVNNKQIFSNDDNPAEVKCLEIGKKWKFSFKGKLVKASLNTNLSAIPAVKEIDAAFTGIFTASTPIFEFSHHMDSDSIAIALAREKWSRDFMASLKENHQVHYEQQGFVSGDLLLDKRSQKVEYAAMRDHSYGKRDWGYMDRHIWMMALMENGDALNVNMVRYPDINELQTGYFITGGKTLCVHSATSMDELEYKNGIPQKFQFMVKLTDGRSFKVLCEKELEYIFQFNKDVYTIFEGIGRFNINGSEGRGILEFGFNRDASRWTRRVKGVK